MEADVALLNAVRRMDSEALVEVFDLYAPALFRYIMRTCDDALMADQIVGDVFAKLLEQLSTGKGPINNLRSYLFETTYHILVDQIRYLQRRVPLEKVDSIPLNGEYSPFNLEDQILFEKACQAILTKLTDYQRHVIILRYMEGFSLRETADILGKSVNIVKATQYRAMTTLRKNLDAWAMA